MSSRRGMRHATRATSHGQVALDFPKVKSCDNLGNIRFSDKSLKTKAIVVDKPCLLNGQIFCRKLVHHPRDVLAGTGKICSRSNDVSRRVETTWHETPSDSV